MNKTDTVTSIRERLNSLKRDHTHTHTHTWRVLTMTILRKHVPR